MKREKLAIEGGTPVRSKPFPSVGNASGRDIGAEELQLLKEVIDSGTLNRVGGRMVEELEREFARFYGVKNAICSTSGTSAIHVALGALNPPIASEIITTPITDFGTVIPILFHNCIPIFADVDPLTFNITAQTIRERITDKTVGIIVVHLFGNPADMDPILQLAKEKNLFVIEDCAQAYLSEYRGKRVGTMGDISAFSLQQSKHITCGDGGITITDDDALARRARLFADKGWPREEGGRGHLFLAPNYRMTELQGAVGLAQLSKLEGIVQRRREMAKKLSRYLEEMEGIQPPYVQAGCEHSYWQYPVLLNEEVFDPPRFAEALRAEGIPCGLGYIGRPIFMYEALKDKRTYGDSRCPFSCPFYGREIEYKEEDCPNTIAVLRKLLVIPWNEFYREEDVEDIASAIYKVANALRK